MDQYSGNSVVVMKPRANVTNVTVDRMVLYISAMERRIKVLESTIKRLNIEVDRLSTELGRIRSRG